MRIAIWQGPSPAGSTAAALTALDRALTAAGAMGAATLVAPEIYLPGYNHASIPAFAQPRGGDWHQSLSGLCREAACGLVVGYAERDGDTVYNSSVAFDASGTEIAHYRKIQLYGPRERSIYAPGSAYCTFDLNGTRAALLICYDVEFAPHIAALAAQGVSLILVSTANMLPFTHVGRVTVPAMAANHGVAIAYANFCGSEGDLTYAGESLIVAASGEVVAQAGLTPALLIADLLTADAALLSTQAADFRQV